MLIWKVIAAHPGITRQGIWERVERDIPAGYVLRRFAKVDREPSLSTLRVCRRRLLNETLHNMESYGLIVSDGAGRDRPFKAVREPLYFGNPDLIDETGTKAAEHMALAAAIRRVRHLLATSSLDIKIGRKNREAIETLLRASEAKIPG